MRLREPASSRVLDCKIKHVSKEPVTAASVPQGGIKWTKNWEDEFLNFHFQAAGVFLADVTQP